MATRCRYDDDKLHLTLIFADSALLALIVYGYDSDILDL
jgi:hypothetical protein